MKQHPNITFIFSAPRSGSTWLWKMLSMHPYVVPFHRENSSESGVYITSKTPKQDILDFAALHPNKLILEKTPAHCFHYEQIKKDFPFSRNIHLLRHPIAIVNSMMQTKMEAFKDYDVDKAVSEFNRYNAAINKIDAFEIYYENLKDSCGWLDDIFDYLGLSITEDAALSIYSSTKNKPVVDVPGHFRKAETDSWQTELSAHELKYIRKHLRGKRFSAYKID